MLDRCSFQTWLVSRTRSIFFGVVVLRPSSVEPGYGLKLEQQRLVKAVVIGPSWTESGRKRTRTSVLL